MVLICISLLSNDIRHLFVCFFLAIYIAFFVKCSSLLPIFKLGCLFVIWVVGILYINMFWIWVLCQIYDSKYFLLVCGLSFLCSVFWRIGGFNFNEFHSCNFFLLWLLFFVFHLRKFYLPEYCKYILYFHVEALQF